MTDLEAQLGETLVAVAKDAPLGSGLADAARRRHRVRRQRRVALAGTAAVAVVMGVGFTLAMGSDGDRPQVAQDPTTTSTAKVPPGWRTVTVENIAVDVPGVGGHWCALIRAFASDHRTRRAPRDRA